MHDRHEDALETDNQMARRFRLCAYLSSSLVIGTLLWGAIFSLPLVTQGTNPVTVVSEGFDKGVRVTLVHSESHLRFIEPAAGPADKN